MNDPTGLARRTRAKRIASAAKRLIPARALARLLVRSLASRLSYGDEINFLRGSLTFPRFFIRVIIVRLRY